MSRSLILSVLLVAACQYSGRDPAEPDADPDQPDARDVPDAGPNDPDAAEPVDTDGDGVLDPDDNCPGQSNAAQHNEDGDDRGDVCDACPHLPGTTSSGDADADGDGIGDQCDPRNGADTVVVFLPFNDATDFSGFAVREGTAAWSVSGGQLHMVATGTAAQQIVLTTHAIDGTVAIDTNIVIDGVPQPGTEVTRLAAVVGAYWETTAPVDMYACGLRSDTANGAASVAAWHYVDPPIVDLSQTAAFPGNLSTGATARVHLHAADNGSSSTLDCAANSATVPLGVPGYVPSGMPGFRTLGTSASFDYLFVVEVGP